MDSTSKIGEFDEETQGTIRKIMFDQRQKMLGLPSSNQLSAEAVLESAKGLPGSPFLSGGAMFDAGGPSSVSSSSSSSSKAGEFSPAGNSGVTVDFEPGNRVRDGGRVFSSDDSSLR